MNNVLLGHPLAVDALFRADDSFSLNIPAGRRLARRRLRAAFTSPEITAEFPFNELLPSWNIRLDEHRQSYLVHVRVADERGWSPWFYLGGGGSVIHRRGVSKIERAPGWGRVKIDYLLLERPARRFQYRVELESSARAAQSPRIGPPALRRFFVSYSNTTGDEALHASRRRGALSPAAPAGEKSSAPPTGANGHSADGAAPWARVLPVPYRLQTAVPHRKLGHEICCPTCVAMILESHGLDFSTLTVAGHAWCGERRIYGIWPRAAQAASRHGLEAWVDRFRTPDDVKRLIAEGVPVMASIRVKEGELPTARYPKSAGHLILIRGFRPDGAFVVNDPYSPGSGGAEIVYSEEEMTKVWFDKGGVGIVIRRPAAAESAR